MNRNYLLVTSNINAEALVSLQGRLDVNSTVDVLTLGFTESAFRSEHKDLLSQIKAKLTFIDLSPYYRDVQARSREFCLNFKFEFPRKVLYRNLSLLDLFSTDSFNMWWFTGLSEMGNFRTRFVEDIYALTLVSIFIDNEYDYVVLDIVDETMYKLVSEYCELNEITLIKTVRAPRTLKVKIKSHFRLWWPVNISIFFISQLIKLFFFRTFKIGYQLASNSTSLLFFSFFPSLWSINQGGDAKNKIFSVIVPQVNDTIPSHDLVHTIDLRNFLKLVVPHRKTFRKQGIIFLENYLRLKDLFYLISPQHIQPLIKLEHKILGNIDERYLKFDISSLVAEALHQSLSDQELYRDILIYRGLNNIFNSQRIPGIIHPSEFQCYEKAIWQASKKHKVKSFAFQHSAIGQNWLNYYFDENEIQLANKNPDDKRFLPLPDCFVTAGEYPQKVMLQNGFRHNQLHLCGALRYDHLADYLKNRKSKRDLKSIYKISNDKPIIMILSGVNAKESDDLLTSVFVALKTISTEYTVYYKMHPLARNESRIKKIYNQVGIENELTILPVNANYFDFISMADVTVFNNSTIGVESIALGVPAISYESYHSMTSFDIVEVGDAVYHAINAEEISSSLTSIIEKNERLTRAQESWPTAITDTFYKLDGHSTKRFIEIIENTGAHRY
jgi:surface carbohydrate biosynthesis protein (TIGR04326 family)